MLIYLLSWALLACSCDPADPAIKDHTDPPGQDTVLLVDPVKVEITRAFTDQTLYAPGEAVALGDFSIKNSSEETVTVDSIWVEVGTANTNGASVASTKQISGLLTLEAGKEQVISVGELISGDRVLPPGAFLVSLGMQLSSPDTTRLLDQEVSAYLTFFRVSETDANLTYEIEKEDYEGLPVFKLHGGLSAEYTVQKSAAALAGGISHSWNIPGPGMGPAPVLSTPDFLERSLEKTVDFYNNTFGSTAPFETVIISTGIPSGAYLARVMNAPVLPVHFLVGAHTTKEIQTLLDYSEQQGTAAYATIGHDYSLSNTKSVAWIKLLSLPEQYRQFLAGHQVKNVIFHGALGQGGESGARKLKDDNDHYGSGSIYLMHFAGTNSETYLKQTIRDYDSDQLGSFMYIADWEAGVIDQQINNISAQIKGETGVESVAFVTTRDAIHLWNMGTYMMLRFLQKNQLELKGFSFNPYLIGHPFFESYMGYVPFLYWQGFEPQHHLDSRFHAIISEAVQDYFPDAEMKALKIWVNSTSNFGGNAQGVEMANALEEEGYQVIRNNFNIGEAWDPADGMNASSEIRAGQLIQTGYAELTSWNSGLQFLTIEDLMNISARFPEVMVEYR